MTRTWRGRSSPTRPGRRRVPPVHQRLSGGRRDHHRRVLLRQRQLLRPDHGGHDEQPQSVTPGMSRRSSPVRFKHGRWSPSASAATTSASTTSSRRVPRKASPASFGSPCKSHYTAGGVDHLARAIQNLAPKIDSVLQGIHALAPSARVFLVGYPVIVPNSGNGCWPLVPISFGDVPYLRGVELELNAMLASEAAANKRRLREHLRRQHRPRRLPGPGHQVGGGAHPDLARGSLPPQPARRGAHGRPGDRAIG